ncbi:KAT8 regulatory NSL complex subunit 1 isoform X2 [Brachyhypopomus gauderio]|uniref:KAT8 regulatory NSL complex subunit 1 isoform X2 n=1 Tax=Brachyhypopomus gauderio TaxID=698409 RepID=UPI004042F3BF
MSPAYDKYLLHALHLYLSSPKPRETNEPPSSVGWCSGVEEQFSEPLPRPCMAAMAPALTDAPAEARHIRLKLADSSENNGGTASILLPSSVSASAGPVKLRPPKSPATGHLSLGKLEPLVASYLCSNVPPVAKESLKVKGILIKQPAPKGCGPLNGSLLGGRGGAGDLLLRTALSGGQLKGLVNGRGVGTGSSAMVPVNGMARKTAVPSTALPEKGSVATVNGDSSKTPASSEALLPLSSKSGDASSPRGEARHLRESVDLHRVPEDTGLNKSPEVTFETEWAPSCAKTRISDSNTPGVPQSSDLSCSSPSPAPYCPSPLSLEHVLRQRAQRAHRRQADLSGSLRRLGKRLRVVQAKQVERHVRQQLSGFMDQALALSSAPGRGYRGSAELQADALGRFLREGSVPAELEKLHLSGVGSLRAAEAQFDSDATASSSGGESDVEEQEELARVDTQQRHVSLWRRAEGRFALDRASIISRWTWLQADISDLEYRIRQQADIYRHIRTSKGPVELGDSAPSGHITAEKAEPPTPPISQNASEAINQSSRSQNDSAMTDFIQSVADLPGSKSSTAPDADCSAARVRPLISCKRRRLVQPSTLPNLATKGQDGYCSLTGQCEVNVSCMMCGINRVLPKAELLYERPLLEKACLHDPNIHPILSLPSDLSLHVHLQRALKSHGQPRSLQKLKSLKKLLLKHKLPLSSSYSSSSSSTLSKHKLRLSNSRLAAVRLSRHKDGSDRSRRQRGEDGVRGPKLNPYAMQTPCRTERSLDKSLGRKRAREASLDEPDSPKLLTEMGNLYASQASIQPSTSGSQTRPLFLPGDGAALLVTSSQASPCSMPARKKRNENSFDINNIVIPMSVAATTRVEKLQYKEIITPSWREVDTFARPLAYDDDKAEVEDLSDAAFAQLHQRCEEQERLRWRWTALTPARRGSRSYKSVDGRTTPSLGGTNPSSPDVGPAYVLQDYGPIPSPLSPPSPDTPCSRDAHMPFSRDSNAPPLRDVPRTLSGEDTRCSTPDVSYEEKMVQPWERRSFPLSEEPSLEPRVQLNAQPNTEPSTQLSTQPNTEPSPCQRFPSGLQSSHCGAGSESEASSP